MSGTIALRPAHAARQEVRSSGSFVATKTITVRNEYGKDEELVAGQTFVHDARHFLVTTYPHLFAREGTRTRSKAAPRRTVARAAASTARKPIALPRKPLIRFDPDARSSVKVELRRDADLTMGDHAYGPGSELETGGGLFGYAYSPKTNMIVIREALGPGPATRARRGAVTIDHDHIDRQAEEYQRHGVDKVVVGAWHSHPTPSGDRPSDHDLLAFARAMQSYRTDHYLGLILTPRWEQNRSTYESYASWARPTVHAWHMHHLGEDQFVCARAEVVRA